MAEIPEDTDSGADALDLAVPKADLYVNNGKLLIFDSKSRQLFEIPVDLMYGGRVIPREDWNPV